MAFSISHPTREDVRLEQNREQMGVILLRNKSGGLASGSIVNVVGSKHFPKSKMVKWCLLTSNVFPVGDICVDDYFFEYWSADLKTVQRHPLSKVAQSNDCYRTTAGLALIPVCPSKVSRLLTNVGFKSSVFDDRRTFPTRYYYEGGESGSGNKQCFIVGSFECRKDSFTVAQFTLITKRDDQGQLQHELRDVDGITIFRSYGEIAVKSHLYPRGAVILIGDGPQATCVGILNFTEEGLICPVFFTPETFTGKVQLYYPTLTDVEEEASSVAIGCSDGRMEVKTSQTDSAVHTCTPHVSSSATAPSQASLPIVTGYGNQHQMFSSAGPGNQDETSLTNDDQTVYPDDYTLQQWQKLYEKAKDECTQLKQQSKQEVSILKDHNAELRNDIKRTEQQNEELLAQVGDLRAENEELRASNENLRSENEELCTRNKELRKAWDAENKTLRAENKELRAVNDELLKDRHVESKELREENRELRKGWCAESKELREENRELRAENKELKAKNEKLLMENEELHAGLEEVPNKFKELLSQPNSAVFWDDTSSIKVSDGDHCSARGSNNVKTEGPSGSSANSPRGDSDGSSKEEEPILDSLRKVVPKLD